MINITDENVTEYINSVMQKNSPLMRELEIEAKAEHIPIIHREAGRFLGVLLSIQRPKKILEIGTAIGYSAMLMHEACKKNVKITTIERDPQMVSRARINLERAGIAEDVEIIEGDAAELIDALTDCYDFVFMDAAKGQYMRFFDSVIKKVHDGSVILTDNVLFMGKVAMDGLPPRKHRTIVVNLREYLEMLCSDKRLDTSILPLGDGMALTRVERAEA